MTFDLFRDVEETDEEYEQRIIKDTTDYPGKVYCREFIYKPLKKRALPMITLIIPVAVKIIGIALILILVSLSHDAIMKQYKKHMYYKGGTYLCKRQQ